VGNPFFDVEQRAVRFASGIGIRAGLVGGKGVVKLTNYIRVSTVSFCEGAIRRERGRRYQKKKNEIRIVNSIKVTR
jgi:hypothetical protein